MGGYWKKGTQEHQDWGFEKQSDKFGYINNPEWTDSPVIAGKHLPCGHWHKGYNANELLPFSGEPIEIWNSCPQAVLVRNSAAYFATSLDSAPDVAHIVRYDLNTKLAKTIVKHTFSPDEFIDEPAIGVHKSAGNLYFIFDGYDYSTYDSKVFVFIIKSDDSYELKTIIFDDDVYELFFQHPGFFQVGNDNSWNLLLIDYSIWPTRKIINYRSTNEGSSWTPYTVYSDSVSLSDAIFYKDSDGTFYIPFRKSGSSPNCLIWKSINHGVTWSAMPSLTITTDTFIYDFIIHQGNIYFLLYKSSTQQLFIRRSINGGTSYTDYTVVSGWINNQDAKFNIDGQNSLQIIAVGMYLPSVFVYFLKIYRSFDGMVFNQIYERMSSESWPIIVNTENNTIVLTAYYMSNKHNGISYMGFMYSLQNGYSWTAVPMKFYYNFGSQLGRSIPTVINELPVWTL